MSPFPTNSNFSAVSCPEQGTGTSHPAQELVSVEYSPAGEGMTCPAVSVQMICAHLILKEMRGRERSTNEFFPPTF